MIQSGEFLGRLLGPLLKTGKSVLIPLGLPTAADAGIHKKILRIWIATLIISSDEIEDIIKIVKSLEDSGLLLLFYYFLVCY